MKVVVQKGMVDVSQSKNVVTHTHDNERERTRLILGWAADLTLTHWDGESPEDGFYVEIISWHKVSLLKR